MGYPVSDYTKLSRFVLYENGAFALQYPSLSAALPGRSRNDNGVLMFLFQFQGRTVDDAWDDATATLRGDTLAVEYDLTMQHSDYENATYVLVP